MASIAELQDALVNADKAGDTESARQLANAIHGMQTSAPASSATPVTRTDKIIKGVVDPIEGGAQLLTHILPKGVVDAGNSINNWIADKTGMLAKIPESGMDALVSNNENAYQAKRAAAGESGFDGYRAIGNVVSPANIALTGKAVGAVNSIKALSSPILKLATTGAITSLTNPVTSGAENYLSEKGKQAEAGAVGGVLAGGAASGLARLLSPKASVNPQLQLLRQEGVNPTVGQALGGWANRIEEKLQSVPLMGDAIAAARQSAGSDLSRAATNRALAPIGQELPSGMAGNDAVLFTRKALGDAYDTLLPKMVVQQDAPYQQAVSGLRQMVGTGAISKDAPKQFNRFLANEVEPLFQGQQAMTGETFKRLQSKVTEQIQRTQASTNADERLLSTAYKELGDQLNKLSTRSNPQLSGELSAINAGYANFKRIQRAASSVAAEDGAFSPAQLQNAVKALDRSKDKARFSEGNALMQDLSSAGKNILSNKVSNSGTVDRLLLGGGAIGSGLLHPAIPIGLGLGAAAYLPILQRAGVGLLASRPDLAQPVANAVRQSAPYLAPVGANAAFGLLK